MAAVTWTRHGFRSYVTLEPAQQAIEKVKVMPALTEAMTLARVDGELRRHASLAEGPVKRIRLANRHAAILLTVNDECWRSYPGRVRQR